MRWFCIATLALGLALAACGDDDAANQNTTKGTGSALERPNDLAHPPVKHLPGELLPPR